MSDRKTRVERTANKSPTNSGALTPPAAPLSYVHQRKTIMNTENERVRDSLKTMPAALVSTRDASFIRDEKVLDLVRSLSRSAAGLGLRVEELVLSVVVDDVSAEQPLIQKDTSNPAQDNSTAPANANAVHWPRIVIYGSSVDSKQNQNARGVRTDANAPEINHASKSAMGAISSPLRREPGLKKASHDETSVQPGREDEEVVQKSAVRNTEINDTVEDGKRQQKEQYSSRLQDVAKPSSGGTHQNQVLITSPHTSAPTSASATLKRSRDGHLIREPHYMVQLQPPPVSHKSGIPPTSLPTTSIPTQLPMVQQPPSGAVNQTVFFPGPPHLLQFGSQIPQTLGLVAPPSQQQIPLNSRPELKGIPHQMQSLQTQPHPSPRHAPNSQPQLQLPPTAQPHWQYQPPRQFHYSRDAPPGTIVHAQQVYPAASPFYPPQYYHIAPPPGHVTQGFSEHVTLPVGPQDMFWSTVLEPEPAIGLALASTEGMKNGRILGSGSFAPSTEAGGVGTEHGERASQPAENKWKIVSAGEGTSATRQGRLQPGAQQDHIQMPEAANPKDSTGPYAKANNGTIDSEMHGSLKVQGAGEGVRGPSLPGRAASSFMCTQCGTTFGQRSNLNKHVRTVHLDQRPFKCTQCDSAFGHKNLLVEHKRTAHDGERPFPCTMCGSSFGRKSNLYQHVQMVHEQKRNFECHICRVSFGLKGNLNKHIRTVHEKLRPFPCDICGACFGLKSDLKRHKSSVHAGHVPVQDANKNGPAVQPAATDASPSSSSTAVRTESNPIPERREE